MRDRRFIYVYIPRAGNRYLPDRREWRERRQHTGVTRILFADIVELWTRFRP